MTNIYHFQVFCEVYLQEEPTIELFRDFFHLNHRTEFSDGPNTELGGMAVQKMKEVTFPHPKLHSHPKEWNQTWFSAWIHPHLMKTPCRVTALNALATHILFLRG